jgi:hypothetical protein
MKKTERTITVLPNSELAALLDEAREASIVLEREGVRYVLVREDADPFEHYDAATVQRSLRSVGHLSPEEAAKLKAAVQAGREEGTRPLTRP